MTFPLSAIPTDALAVAPCIVLLGYTVFGATGFGSSIISVPGLAHFFPLTFTVPLITTTDALASMTAAVRYRRLVAWREIVRLLPAMLIGIASGMTLLLNLPREPALLALGVFAAGYGTYVILGPPRIERAPPWLVWPVGLAGGIFSALLGTAGPIYVVFLSARIADKSALRATTALVVAVAIWTRLVLFVVLGVLLDRTLVAMVLLLLPAVALGLWLGNRLHHALSHSGVLRLIAGLLVVNGIALILRAIEAMRS
ncbi:MAG TPA: sulfite exporter TauE/SafE family protein [Casimicrobiaceae bacterium]